jgi:hypothetical protein
MTIEQADRFSGMLLSDDNGQHTGILDGNYSVKMDMWWGTYATEYRLYENGECIRTQPLPDRTPQAQSVVIDITGKQIGTYEYWCELVNDTGLTSSTKMLVNIVS